MFQNASTTKIQEDTFVASESSASLRSWLGEADDSVAPGSACACSTQTLSTWDRLASESSIQVADDSAARTGYAGVDRMAAGTDAYGVEAMTITSDPDKRTYWVPSRGLSAICHGLLSKLQQCANARILLQHRVTAIVRKDGAYSVSASVR